VSTQTKVKLERRWLQESGSERPPDPCVLVIFGASGDLTHRKLDPGSNTRSNTAVSSPRTSRWSESPDPRTRPRFGASRLRKAVSEFGRDEMHEDVWKRLASGMHYVTTDFSLEGGESDRTGSCSSSSTRSAGTQGNRVYYLAVPPNAIRNVVDKIVRGPAAKGWVRLIVAETVRARFCQRQGDERRHRHALRRERDLPHRPLPRQGNGPEHARVPLRPTESSNRSGNRRYIDNVQITVAESLGNRGPGQLLRERRRDPRRRSRTTCWQLLAITAMEPPADFEADAVRNER